MNRTDEKSNEMYEDVVKTEAMDEKSETVEDELSEELSVDELDGVAGGAGISWKPLAGAQAKKKPDFMEKGTLTC